MRGVPRCGVEGRSRSRLQLTAVAVALVFAGLASRRWPAWQPAVVAAYAGDVLWAVLVFVLLAGVAPRASTTRVAAAAASIALITEGSQLVHTPWLDAIRTTRFGALVLGQGFLWSDLGCYGLGVSLAALVDGWRRGSLR